MNQAPTHPGDDGRSDLLSGDRPPKHDPVFGCLGWLDELNAAIGHLRAAVRDQSLSPSRPPSQAGESRDTPGLDPALRVAQLSLGRIMGLVASAPKPGASSAEGYGVVKADISALEIVDQELRTRTVIEQHFYVPGDDSLLSAIADVARARCRTAERALVLLDAGSNQYRLEQRYLNRLSDYLFVVARHLGAQR